MIARYDTRNPPFRPRNFFFFLQKGSRVPTQALLQSGQSTDIEMPTIQYDKPPAWVNTVKQVNTAIQRITDGCEFALVVNVRHCVCFSIDKMQTRAPAKCNDWAISPFQSASNQQQH
jgi:hypothetical protein